MTTIETARENLKRAREEWNFTGEQRKAAKARLDSAKEAYREASDTERAREECYAELARRITLRESANHSTQHNERNTHGH